VHDLIRRILCARVYDVAVETPLDHAPLLSRRLDNHVHIKREDLQPVFSFKLRGAYNKIAALSPSERARGVVAASAGNHAQGVALAASRLDVRATIVMPTTTPSIKVAAVRSFGAEVILSGDSFDEARGEPACATSAAPSSSTPTTTSTSSPARAPSPWRSCASSAAPSTRSSCRSAAAG